MSVKKYPRETIGRKLLGLFAVFALASAPGLSPAYAQVQTIDPNDAIDADLNNPGYNESYQAPSSGPDNAQSAPVDNSTSYDAMNENSYDQDGYSQNGSAQYGTGQTGTVQSGNNTAVASAQDNSTYQDDDLIGAAEGVFGKGAKGLAGVIEDILQKQGRPNAYIAGREASGAFVVGLRYGSGELHHKIEGSRPVYWTGPSVGFDIGANAANTFVLVYNLYDTEELFQRFPAGEGAAYFVGGFHVSYLRSGDKVLIPVRLGAGLRLGANIGYMKFSKKQRWLPF
ncbi:DUF1134 domain-containing protein [Parasphingorhabdus sp. JC815]|uniref:DUF1134 domain-containing protein n=1 Tax=Parasphingorhabdus sp. JC815 TaxID=3232140 RepID=UPI0034587CBC